MKLRSIYFVLIFSLIAHVTFAQKVYLWLDAGVKASAGPAMMVNSDILNGSNYMPKVNGTYSVGGKFGLNFGEYYGITLDGTFSQSKQEFTYNQDQGGSSLAVNEYRWTSYNLYPLFRYNRNINYIELGPKFSWIQSVRQANNTSSFTDVSGDFVTQNIDAVLGFGYYAAGDDAFTAIIGFRLEYAINDFVSAQGMANNQVALGLVDGNATTNPASFHIVFEMNWGLGYYAKTVCGGRARFFRF